MQRYACILGVGLLALIVGSSVAADPAIAVAATRRDANGAVVSLLPVTDKQGNMLPPQLLLGEYVIATGQGFPANQPVTAFLVAQNQAYPLIYQELTPSVAAPQPAPMTDATGGFQNYAFALPAAGQVAGANGEIQISAGSLTARAPVGLDTGIATTAGRGDKIAVGIGAGFSIAAIILIFLLLRGLPLYPVGATTTRRAREPDAT